MIDLPAIAELGQFDQWVAWKYYQRPGKVDKPPINPHTGKFADHSNPSDWGSYAQACVRGRSNAGVGFVFHPSDPYSGVDLDGCAKPGIQRIRTRDDIEPWAQRWIDALQSYTEISPSGTGVKIFVRGTLPATLTHSMGAHIGIEVYSQQRYFTVTGHHLAGTPTEIREAQTALDLLWAEYHQEVAPAPARPSPKVSPGEAAAGRASLDDLKARFRAEHTVASLLEGYGAKQKGSSKEWSCPFCEHNHTYTLFIYEGRLFSRSPNCRIPQKRGLDAFGLYVLIEHNNDIVATTKKLNPIARSNSAPARSLPDYLTEAEAERRRQDAQRKRSARHQVAAETRAEVRARAAADATLRPSDRAVLDAMLAIAGDRDWCRPSKERIAEVSGLGLGTVKRALFSAAKGGRLEGRYFVSTGDGGGPKTTAIRTFLRGSFAPEMIPMLNHESDSYSDSVSCEGGGVDPAELLERLSFASYLRNLAAELGEVLDLAELASLSLVEQEACEARLLAQLADGNQVQAVAVAFADGACYDPAADWTAGGVLDLSEWRDPRELRPRASGDVDDQAAPAELLDPMPEPEPLVRSAPIEPAAAREYWALKHKKPVNFKQARWIAHRLAELEIWLPASEALATTPERPPQGIRGIPRIDRRRRRAAAPPPQASPAAADQLQLTLEVPSAGGFAPALGAAPPSQALPGGSP
jgi:hypothetical protein